MGNEPNIVVVDSGVGGISVLRDLKARLPSLNYIYIADNLNMPYGDKSEKQLIQIAFDLVKKALVYKPQMIVLACNTLTAHALNALRSNFTDVLIVGCEPAVRVAAKLSKKRVLVLATQATVDSQRFKTRFSSCDNFDVLPLPQLASLVEQGDTQQILNYIHSKLDEIINNYDVVALGCTHYVLIKQLFVDLYSDVTFVDGNDGIVNYVQRLLPSVRRINRSSTVGTITLMLTKSNLEQYCSYLQLINLKNL